MSATESSASVHDVAAYILQKLGTITPWKLQKLAYYSQAWSLVWDERPLFPERIEAWGSGPVAPALYKKHIGKLFVSQWRKGDAGNLDAAARETVDAVVAYYGDWVAVRLTDLVRLEAPWKDARPGLKPGECGYREISLASMAEYYGGLLEAMVMKVPIPIPDTVKLTKNYEYGLLAPIEGLDKFNLQNRLIRNYRHAKGWIERERREKIATIICEQTENRVAYREVLAEIQSVCHDDTRAKAAKECDLKELRTRRDAIEKPLRAEEKAARKAHQAAIAAINAEAQARTNQALATQRKNGLSSSNYLEVNSSFLQAAGSKLKCRVCRQYVGGHETCCNQVASPSLYASQDKDWCASDLSKLKGITDASIFNPNPRGWIDPTPIQLGTTKRQREGKSGAGQERLSQRKTLRMRVGGKGDLQSFLVHPMPMHRLLPVGSVIKHMKVFRTWVDLRCEWKVIITIEHEVPSSWNPSVRKAALNYFFQEVDDPTPEGDPGWRPNRKAVLVAKVTGDNGDEQPILMEAAVYDMFNACRSLQGIRESNFNRAQKTLCDWLFGRQELPSWLSEAKETLAKWESIDRLFVLVGRWAYRRFAGDSEIFLEMDKWRYQDWHLRHWMAEQNKKAERRRNDGWRRVAKSLCERYSAIWLPHLNLASMARKHNVKGLNEDVGWIRSRAALSVFRNYLVEAAKKLDTSLYECSKDIGLHEHGLACEQRGDAKDLCNRSIKKRRTFASLSKAKSVANKPIEEEGLETLSREPCCV